MACFDTLLCEQLNKYGHRFGVVVKDDSEITIIISAERVQRHSAVMSKLEKKPSARNNEVWVIKMKKQILKVLVEILALLYASSGHTLSKSILERWLLKV